MLHIICEQAIQMIAEQIVANCIDHENTRAAVKHVITVVDVITTAVEIAAL